MQKVSLRSSLDFFISNLFEFVWVSNLIDLTGDLQGLINWLELSVCSL